MHVRMSKLRDPFESTYGSDRLLRDNCAPGRGYSTDFYTGRVRPEVQPFTLLYTIFDRKRYPFCISSIEKGYPFHIPFLELCISFSCCRCTVF